jgi:hypothetical protein
VARGHIHHGEIYSLLPIDLVALQEGRSIPSFLSSAMISTCFLDPPCSATPGGRGSLHVRSSLLIRSFVYWGVKTLLWRGWMLTVGSLFSGIGGIELG